MPDDLFTENVLGSNPRLMRVTVENVKRVALAEIDASGTLTEIRGDTGQGKTAILDAVRGALDGIAPGLVRHGADKASVTIVMDRATIHRVINADGTGDKVRVLDPEGVPLAKAKDFLRALAGDDWNALDWVLAAGGPEKGRTERERTQRNQLLAAIPCAPDKKEMNEAVAALGPEALAIVKAALAGVKLDGHALDVCAELGKAVKATRTEAGRAAKDAESELKALPEVADAPEKTVEALTVAESDARGALATERAKAYARESTAKRRDALAEKVKAAESAPGDKHSAQAIRDGIKVVDEIIASRRKTLAELRAKVEAEEKAIESALEANARQRDLLAAADAIAADEAALAALNAELGPDPTDALASLETAAREAGEALAARQAFDRRATAKGKAEALAARVAALDRVTELFRDTLPARIMARMEMPVDGLAVGAESVTLRGVPLHQLGTSEAIRLGVSIWRKRNPGASFLGIDRGESLGKEGLRALAEIAEAEKIQLLVTIVDADAVPAPSVVVMRGGEAVQ